MPLRQKIQTSVSYKFVSYMRVLTVYIYICIYVLCVAKYLQQTEKVLDSRSLCLKKLLTFMQNSN